MGAWGGVHLEGDSLTRHVVNALFIMLRDRPDGAFWKDGDRCQGDHAFDDRHNCRHHMVSHSRLKLPMGEASVCQGNVELQGLDYGCPMDPEGIVARYSGWRSGATADKSALSTIIINAWGLHCKLDPVVAMVGALKPFFFMAQSHFPRPLLLFMGIHAPGRNKPVEWLAEQGPAATKRYNSRMRGELLALQPGRILDGAVGFVDWYGMSDGASSFDGTHFSYQVNMEKAMLLLNLIDILWAEAVAEGGKSPREGICPGQECGAPSNYDN